MDSLDNGWVKIHRKIRNNWIWQKPDYFRAWIDLIMLVNYEKGKTPIGGKLFTVHPGYMITSVDQLAKRWHWSWKKTDKFLNMLESDHMILKKKLGNGKLISVVNYAEYQGFSEPLGRTSGRTNDRTSGRTSDRTGDRQYKKGKEGKEIKEEKEGNSPSAHSQEPVVEDDDPGMTADEAMKVWKEQQGNNE